MKQIAETPEETVARRKRAAEEHRQLRTFHDNSVRADKEKAIRENGGVHRFEYEGVAYGEVKYLSVEDRPLTRSKEGATTRSDEEETGDFLAADADGTAHPRYVVTDADGTTYPIYVSPVPLAEHKPRQQKPQDTISALEQVETRYRAKSNSDAEMEALLRWLIHRHYSNDKRLRAKKIREISLTVIAASCRRRTTLYPSVRAGLQGQYKPFASQGLNYKRGFLLEIRREIAAQIDSVNSAKELANLPKAVQKVIAREARHCLRAYTHEKRLTLPDSDSNAIETVIADPKDDLQKFIDREDELVFS